MKHKVLVVLMLFTFMLFCAGAAVGQFEHPDLKSGKKQVHSIILMPVRAEITKVGIKGSEPMTEQSRAVEQNLAPVISEVLRKVGCTVNEKAFTPDAFAQDPELRFAVDDLQKQFDEELQQMARKSKDVRKGRFTLGDSVAKLSASEQSDALLFVRASAQVLTGGKKAFGVLAGGQSRDTVSMNIGLVDANTGEVLYFAKPFILKNLAKDTAETRSGIEKSFKNFAKANASPQQTAESGQ